MKTVVIAGASGVVGARALQHLLAHPEVGRIVALGRRGLDVKHAKLGEAIVDFESASALADAIPDDVAIAICCLGTTMKKAGSKQAFAAVDRDAVVAFGRAALRKGAPRFLLVSSIGADANARTFYLRTKGEAEAALAELGFAQLTIVRPSVIDDEGTRADHRLGERVGLGLARAVFSVAGKTSRWAPVGADTIGRSLVRLAMDDSTERVRRIESDELHALGR
jgi:uncharacterized protein YbjT (DUF2867 family)